VLTEKKTNKKLSDDAKKTTGLSLPQASTNESNEYIRRAIKQY